MRNNLPLSAEKSDNSDQHHDADARSATAVAVAAPVQGLRHLARVRGDNRRSRCVGGIAGGIGIDGDSAGSHGAGVIACAGN